MPNRLCSSRELPHAVAHQEVVISIVLASGQIVPKKHESDLAVQDLLLRHLGQVQRDLEIRNEVLDTEVVEYLAAVLMLGDGCEGNLGVRVLGKSLTKDLLFGQLETPRKNS